MACIRGRHGLAKGFLKIEPVLVGFIRKEALPTTPHASDSGVAGDPVVMEVHCGHDTAQIVFNNLPFPLTVYQTNTDLELTLASGDQHSALSPPSVVDAISESRLCRQGGGCQSPYSNAQGHSVLDFPLASLGLRPLPPWRGKGGMGGGRSMAWVRHRPSPPPSPSPVEGEGKD